MVCQFECCSNGTSTARHVLAGSESSRALGSIGADGTECGKRSEGLARMATEDGSLLQPLAHRGGLQERLPIEACRWCG